VTADPAPWIAAQSLLDAKRIAPAAARNRDAILAVLQRALPTKGNVLEIASGSGEHVVHFARALPQLYWQPSDCEPAALASIAAWAAEAGLPNIAMPIALDVLKGDWPVARADAILCINMIHIAPWAATLGVMSAAGTLLERGAPLYLYGPFREAEVPLAPSNADFDASLKSRNPDWGLRWVHEIAAIAKANGLSLDERIAMPANNLSLIFHKA
jgi:Protein of unknown function (DUF938)